ncbi:YlmH/Sll1252 family protein [uncultured Clostridium sp.]|uniref:YlmH/Sll1252 family protein n=1 Tax=uncultured Clostridium sp. TaxID=59620 RepID=UPI00265D31A3|nr:YlmH/Sll1252 family protein [uncultured Clostridium sp.]
MLQEKEEQLLKKRMIELAGLCYQRDIQTSTGFLSLNEQTIFHSIEKTLPHRDYLGALMNLGIERSCIGDILMKENGCCVFCQEKMADYLCQELTMVRHTSVICRRADATEPITPKMERVSGSVASPRLDSVIAMVFSSSRTKILPLIEGEKVFIDGKQVTSPAVQLKEGEIVSVRGMGKFRFAGSGGLSKKGRLYVYADKYV